MSETIDGMFEKIPFEEAYQTTMNQNKQLKQYKDQGAVLLGERPLDKQYTAFVTEAAEYQMQFSTDELFTILGKSLEEAVIKIKDYARKNVEYTHQGAVLDGERPLDKEYTEFIVESKEYHSQFSQDELQALVKRAFEEIRQPR